MGIRLNIFLLLFTSLLLLNSCFEEPEVKLLQSDKELVDSLFSSSVDSLQIEIDSLCKERRELIYSALVDSFMQERLSEIEDFIK